MYLFDVQSSYIRSFFYYILYFDVQSLYVKGIVQRKLRWVKIGIKR